MDIDVSLRVVPEAPNRADLSSAGTAVMREKATIYVAAHLEFKQEDAKAQ
jgi:hypothetical protein